MALVKKEVEIAKEADDVLALVVELVKDLKAGKDIAAIGAENLPLLLQAVAGLDQVGAELADKQAVATTVSLRVAELVAALA